jgi:hypothetical protein
MLPMCKLPIFTDDHCDIFMWRSYREVLGDPERFYEYPVECYEYFQV